MERHKCKLCFKSFSNGRALGGHMRSHFLNLAVPEKHGEGYPSAVQLIREETESVSSSSSEDEDDGVEVELEEGEEEEEEEEEKGVYYGLRENPKKSIRLVDPEFSFAVDAAGSGGSVSVVLQDRESETESSKNLTRRRSKRTRKLLLEQGNINFVKKLKFIKPADSWAEPEPASSISDATTEEEVAFCLMMLSRDKWIIKRKEQDDDDDDDDEEGDQTEKSFEESGDESGEINKSCKVINNNNNNNNRSRGKYKCETCNKVFKSYQALGGHRASHKKLRLHTPNREAEFVAENAGGSGCVVAEKKIHQCPYCFRVFASGQALGGHKRSHLIGVAAAAPPPTPTPPAATTTHRHPPPPASNSSKLGENLSSIDLNLPPPMEEDDVSQIELSAVSDAEFVNHIKR